MGCLLELANVKLMLIWVIIHVNLANLISNLPAKSLIL